MTDQQVPHRRYNPLTGSWVLVSPHRTARPWQGQTEDTAPATPEYVDDCYLCPGNQRANGEHNPAYDDVFVFDNDYAALLSHAAVSESGSAPAGDQHELLRQSDVRGTCRVVCYSPKHSQTMATMSVPQIRRVIDAWSEQQQALAADYRWVQVFENRGAVMGCSNPHPHGQIWALDALPTEAQRELDQQQAHFERSGRPLLLDYVQVELEQEERIVIDNDSWLIVVPYWAVWPFEALILPKASVQSVEALTAAQRDDLADALHRLCRGYDQLFDTPFPYSMGWHSAPTDRDYPAWQLHAHVYPPLLRSATIKKFMVGFEMLGEPQRDLTPEAACQLLRAKI